MFLCAHLRLALRGLRAGRQQRKDTLRRHRDPRAHLARDNAPAHRKECVQRERHNRTGLAARHKVVLAELLAKGRDPVVRHRASPSVPVAADLAVATTRLQSAANAQAPEFQRPNPANRYTRGSQQRAAGAR